MFPLVVLGALLVIFLCIFWYRHFYSPFLVLKRAGIPHSKWTPFLGNIVEITKLGFTDYIKRYNDKNVYGFYVGADPYIIVQDTEILKEILVKYFNQFPERNKEPFLMILSRGDVSSGLIFMEEEQWRILKPIVSPSFSGKKLKLLSSILDGMCVTLRDKVDEMRDCTSIEVFELYGQFTLQAILATAFGAEINILKGEGGRIPDAAAGLLRNVDERVLFINHALRSQFSNLLKLISYTLGRWFNLKTIKCYRVLSELGFDFIKQRRASPSSASQNKDFLQLLMSAKAEEGTQQRSTLTDNEIVGLCVDFLLAGFETTKNSLTYTSYLLALNPDKQDLLCEAIDNYYQENEDVSLYDASMSIPYLEWVALESLRMFPPVNRVVRLCSETVTIKGVTFPKGSRVVINVIEMHYSTDHWDQPKEFRPERFSPECKKGRDPLAHIPFGWGTRSCIGMRFALMEIKMALLTLLKENKFVRTPDTQVPLKFVRGITVSPRDGVYLKIEKRHPN